MCNTVDQLVLNIELVWHFQNVGVTMFNSAVCGYTVSSNKVQDNYGGLMIEHGIENTSAGN